MRNALFILGVALTVGVFVGTTYAQDAPARSERQIDRLEHRADVEQNKAAHESHVAKNLEKRADINASVGNTRKARALRHESIRVEKKSLANEKRAIRDEKHIQRIENK